MERKEIVRCFFKKVVLPVALAAFLFFLFRLVCTEENGVVNYVLLWILCGIRVGGADKILDYHKTLKGAFLCIPKNRKQTH